MKLSVRPGARNIKEVSTARIRKVSPKRHTAQEERKDNAGERLNQKAFLKD